ncbi:MAG TPA: DNA-processing protein DprA [Chloroflexota bacterium]|nr:DNA-processing protein DprA [Chloroflexota bacterium]
MSSPDIGYLVGLSLLPGIGPARFHRILDHFGEPELAWRASERELVALGVDARSMPALVEKRRTISIEAELEKLRRHDVRVLSIFDVGYPLRLKEIFNAPPLLYIKGEITRQDDSSIGVVGTRGPTVYGKELTARVVPELVRVGLTVVSGLARGIDSIAHHAALDAGGRTIAVLGSGLDVIYPAENRRLFERIAQRGAVISDYPLGTKPDAFNFPARNRIISGLSLGTVVMEAQLGSGALITADYALEQNREVFAFPGRATDRGSSGCNRLIREGRAKLVTGSDDILEELDLTAAVRQLEIKVAIPANDDEGRLLALLSHEPLHVDELVRRSAMAAPTVTSTLLMMELKGAVRQVGSMSFVLAH